MNAIQEALDKALADERRKAFAQAMTAVDQVIRPLGYGGGATNSPWNQGYEKAKREALDALYALSTGKCPLAARHALLVRCQLCGAAPEPVAVGGEQP